MLEVEGNENVAEVSLLFVNIRDSDVLELERIHALESHAQVHVSVYYLLEFAIVYEDV